MKKTDMDYRYTTANKTEEKTPLMHFTEHAGIVIAKFTSIQRFSLPVCEEVKETLRPMLEEKERMLILDLDGIDFMDSSGIGCIITLYKTAKRVGSRFRFCNLFPEVREIFELLNLQVLFNLTLTREDCIAIMLAGRA
jgi:anti-anti-sigma factor